MLNTFFWFVLIKAGVLAVYLALFFLLRYLIPAKFSKHKNATGVVVAYPLVLVLHLLFLEVITGGFASSSPREYISIIGLFTLWSLALLYLPFRIASGKPIAKRHIVVTVLACCPLLAGGVFEGWVTAGVLSHFTDAPGIIARLFLRFAREDGTQQLIACCSVVVIGCAWVWWTVSLIFRARGHDAKSLVRLLCWWFLSCTVLMDIAGVFFVYMLSWLDGIGCLLIVLYIFVTPAQLMLLLPIVLFWLADRAEKNHPFSDDTIRNNFPLG